jgi:hypothetical protein
MLYPDFVVDPDGWRELDGQKHERAYREALLLFILYRKGLRFFQLLQRQLAYTIFQNSSQY